jgi:hypothetical protein
MATLFSVIPQPKRGETPEAVKGRVRLMKLIFNTIQRHRDGFPSRSYSKVLTESYVSLSRYGEICCEELEAELYVILLHYHGSNALHETGMFPRFFTTAKPKKDHFTGLKDIMSKLKEEPAASSGETK